MMRVGAAASISIFSRSRRTCTVTVAALREYLSLRRHNQPIDINRIVEVRLPTEGPVDARRALVATEIHINTAVAGGHTVGEACERSLWTLLGVASAWGGITQDVAGVSTWLTGGATT